MPSKKTFLKVHNQSGTSFKTSVSDIDSYDWDGSSRPDHNFDNCYIPSGSYKREREEINAFANGKWVKLTFKFDNGYESYIRFCQHYALKGCPHEDDFKIDNGKFEIEYDHEGDETMVITVKDNKQLQQLVKAKQKEAQIEEEASNTALNDGNQELADNLEVTIGDNLGEDASKFDKLIDKFDSAASGFTKAKEHSIEANEKFRASDQTSYNRKIAQLQKKITEASNMKVAVINIKKAYLALEYNMDESMNYFKQAIEAFKAIDAEKYKNKINNIEKQIEEVNEMKNKLDEIINKLDVATERIIHDINSNVNLQASELNNQINNLSVQLVKKFNEQNKDFAKKLAEKSAQLNNKVTQEGQSLRDLVNNTSNDVRKQIKDTSKANIEAIERNTNNILTQTQEVKNVLVEKAQALKKQLNDAQSELQSAQNETRQALIKKQDELKAQLASAQDKIITIAQNQHKQQQELIESKSKAIQENITLAKTSIADHLQKSTNALNAQILKAKQELETNAKSLSIEQQKELKTNIDKLTAQMQEQTLGSRKLMKELNKEQVETIRKHHIEQIQLHKNQSDLIKQQIKEAKSAIRADIESTQQKLEAQMQKVEQNIISETNNYHKEQMNTLVTQHQQVIQNIEENKGQLAKTREALEKELARVKQQADKYASEHKQHLDQKMQTLSKDIEKHSTDIKKLTKEAIVETKFTHTKLQKQLQEAEAHRSKLAKIAADDREQKFVAAKKQAEENCLGWQKKLQEQDKLLTSHYEALSKDIFVQNDLIIQDIAKMNSNISVKLDAAQNHRSTILQKLTDKLAEAEQHREAISKHLASKADEDCQRILDDHSKKCNDLQELIKYASEDAISAIGKEFKNNVEKINQQTYLSAKTIPTSQLLKEAGINNLSAKGQFDALSNKVDFSKKQAKEAKQKFRDDNNKKHLIDALKHYQQALIYTKAYPDIKLNKAKEQEKILKKITVLTEKLHEIEISELKTQEDLEILEVMLAATDYAGKLKLLKDKRHDKNIKDKVVKSKIKQKIAELKEQPIKLLKKALELENSADEVDITIIEQMFSQAHSEFKAIAEQYPQDPESKLVKAIAAKIQGNNLYNEGVELQIQANEGKGSYKEALDKFSSAKQQFKVAVDAASDREFGNNFQENYQLVQDSIDAIEKRANDVLNLMSQATASYEKHEYTQSLKILENLQEELAGGKWQGFNDKFKALEVSVQIYKLKVENSLVNFGATEENSRADEHLVQELQHGSASLNISPIIHEELSVGTIGEGSSSHDATDIPG